MTTIPPAEREAGPPDPRIEGGLPRDPFHLGVPHLAEAWLSVPWLLRECCHGHGWAIALRLGTTPGKLRDATGARALASVVPAHLTGRPEAFAEDDVVEFRRIVWPGPQTGWRSETVLTSRAGAHAVVELVTAFAKRDGTSSTALAGAIMPPDFTSLRDAPECRRALLLRASGRAGRAAAEAMEGPPHLSVRIERDRHMNGVALCYFASFVSCFIAAEALALPPGWKHMPRGRDVHFFGNLDAGDRLDITLHPVVSSLDGPAGVTVESAGRCRSDGEVIATCRSRYEARDGYNGR
jgi:probable biosynthetic protein (TIGR04098 family)